jgi:hypothetical protein
MKQAEAWLVPSIALTVIAAVSALVLVPNATGLMPALLVLPAWMVVAVLIACLYGFGRAALTGDPTPVLSLKRFLKAERRKITAIALVLLLAGLNMVSFMWVKTLLNYKVSFWADPYLARADFALFAGHEPWALLHSLDFSGAGLVYHPVWFVLLIFALLMTAAAKPSPKKSAVLLSYFVLWTVVGPLIHTLLPAAGPIFYERFGYGARYAAISSSPEVKQVADYLWDIYATKRFGAASGISAMPSMHVAMSTWTVIAFHQFARRWLPVALIGWAVIASLSIALGWHYASDGIVGSLAALGTYAALSKALQLRASAGQTHALTPQLT